MPDTPVTPHRWFRFGLRTMFVVLTVFSLWLGWQAKIVRDRREALLEVRGSNTGFQTFAEIANMAKLAIANDPSSGYALKPLQRAPLVRGLMGDQLVAAIVTPADYPTSRLDRLRRLFPEALTIMRVDDELSDEAIIENMGHFIDLGPLAP